MSSSSHYKQDVTSQSSYIHSVFSPSPTFEWMRVVEINPNSLESTELSTQVFGHEILDQSTFKLYDSICGDFTQTFPQNTMIVSNLFLVITISFLPLVISQSGSTLIAISITS
ncbi:hypothetical protein P9112_006964 [Eukaryota sp. TZLM1-RC]